MCKHRNVAVLLEGVMLQRVTWTKYPVGYQLLSKYMYNVFVIYEMSKTTFAATEITAQKLCSVQRPITIYRTTSTPAFTMCFQLHIRCQ